MNDGKARLTRCFSVVFPDLSESEIPLASTATVGEWDSVATATLVAVVEEEFGVEIAPDTLLDTFVSFDLILDHLAGLGVANAH